MSKQVFAHRLGAFSSATLLSRVLGYIRDALVAAYFGGGWVTDAFYAAFRVPNLLRRFLGEGSMTAAFIPVFSDISTKEGKQESQKFLNSLLSGLVLILIAIVALGIFFAPTVAKIVAWGFTQNPLKFKLTVDLIRLIFPFLFVISIAALITAVLNSSGRFFIPAFAPAGQSIGIITFILLLANRMASPIHGLAISVVVGGAIHLLIQIPGLFKEGYRFQFVKPFAHPGVKMFFVLLGPTIIGLGSDQINAFVDQFCASFLRDGAITALYNSNRIMQLPLALFGIAVASVALPALSQAASKNNDKEYKDLLSFSVRIANFVLIPSMIGLIVLGGPIVKLLFEHGKFSAEYSQLTLSALIPYALGLPAYSAFRIFATGFYAKKNTKTPVRVALWAMLLHVGLNYVLMWDYGVAGLALSTSIAAWFQTGWLFLLIRKEFGAFGGRGIIKSFLFGSIAGIFMGGLCYFLAFKLLVGFSVLIQMPVCIGASLAFYLGFAKILKIEEYQYLLDAIKKRKISV